MRPIRRGAVILPLALAMTVSVSVLRATPAGAETLILFTSVLSGASETPPVPSPSQGVAEVLLVKETNMVCYRLSYSPLGGTETVAHFHGPGAPSVMAGILVGITPSPSPVGSPKHGCVQFTKDQVKDLNKGLVYLNVHSSIAPNGEIRGQVVPTKIKYTKVTPPSSPSGAFLSLYR